MFRNQQGINIKSGPSSQVLAVTDVRCLGKFWSQYKAKDKTCRIIQYFSRILVVYYRKFDGPESDMAETFWTLSQNVSLARCAFRLFRWIDEFNSAYASLCSGQYGLLWLASSLRGLCIGTFIFMNNLYFLLHWRVLRFTAASKMKIWASYVRLCAETCGFWWMVMKCRSSSRRLIEAKHASDKEAAVSASESWWAAFFKAVTFVCNFSTYSDISGLYRIAFGSKMSQVLFGTLGTLSALAGMREPWKRSVV